MRYNLRLIALVCMLFGMKTRSAMSDTEYRRRKIDLRVREVRARERAVKLKEREVKARELDVLLTHWRQFILPEGDDTTNLCFAGLITAQLHDLFADRIAELPAGQKEKLQEFLHRTPSERRRFAAYTPEALSALCAELMRGFETVEHALGRPDEPERGGAGLKDDEDD